MMDSLRAKDESSISHIGLVAGLGWHLQASPSNRDLLLYLEPLQLPKVLRLVKARRAEEGNVSSTRAGPSVCFVTHSAQTRA